MLLVDDCGCPPEPIAWHLASLSLVHGGRVHGYLRRYRNHAKAEASGELLSLPGESQRQGC